MFCDEVKVTREYNTRESSHSLFSYFVSVCLFVLSPPKIDACRLVASIIGVDGNYTYSKLILLDSLLRTS